MAVMRTNNLYPYQAIDSVVMAESNVLLAYDMGLGKTPTTLVTLDELRRRGDITGPGVIVVPASLKWQWEREVQKWVTNAATQVIHGGPAQRLNQYIAAQTADYVIMTYDSFVRDWDGHKNLKAFLVLDEATAIKNFKSKRSQHFKKVRDRYTVRFALTGTPIENGNPEELFSILEWVDPEILGKYWPFEKRYIRRNPLGWIEGYRNLDDFHARIKPYVLRRTHKEPEVAKYLPKVRHLDPYIVEMDRTTEKAYTQIADGILSSLDEMLTKYNGATNNTYLPDHPDGELMGKIQTARMLLDHPSVVANADGDYATFITSAGRLPASHPKLDAVIEYVNDFLDADPANKVVIFTSFVHMAELLEFIWKDMAVKFTGQMSAKARDEAKLKFQHAAGVRVFVSTDAGGYGLDLPQANLLVNYDQPWMAGLLKQRNARIRRASSDWDYVVIQDFVVGGTLEERMLDMLAHKMAVSDAIIDGEGITEDGQLISSLDSLRSFLNKPSVKEPIRAS